MPIILQYIFFMLGCVFAVAVTGAVVIAIRVLFEEGSFTRNFKIRYSAFFSKAIDIIGYINPL